MMGGWEAGLECEVVGSREGRSWETTWVEVVLVLGSGRDETAPADEVAASSMLALSES